MQTYDFSSKTEYRRKIWNEIEKVCTVPKALRTVVYLDTREALETVFLLDRGYRPENLIAINREPVEVALLTQHLKKSGLPTVRTYGVDWTRAVATLGPVHVVNFDGMGCLHDNLLNTVSATVDAVRPRVLAFNMLGGREQFDDRTRLKAYHQFRSDWAGERLPSRTSFGKVVNPNHAERIRTVVHMGTMGPWREVCRTHVTSIAWDVYQSESRQPMVWAVAALKPHTDRDRSWLLVEKQWCISPSCFYLRNPSSFRYAALRRESLGKLLFPEGSEDETLERAAERIGITTAAVEGLLKTYDFWRDRCDAMDAANPIVQNCKSLRVSK